MRFSLFRSLIALQTFRLPTLSLAVSAAVGICASRALAQESSHYATHTFTNGPLTARLREQVGACCGNAAGTTSLLLDFSCTRGAAAADCLRSAVAALQTPILEGFRQVIREIPPAMRERVGTLCGMHQDFSTQAACAKDLLRLEDDQMYRAAVQTRADITDIELAIEAWGVAEQSYSMLSLACDRALGNVRPETRGGTPRLVRHSPADPACNRHPMLPAADSIPYRPTSASARAALAESRGESSGGRGSTSSSRPRPSTRPRTSPSTSPSATPSSAPSASPSAGPSGAPANLLFDATLREGIPALEIQCPPHLPRVFCGGGRFDPSRYSRQVEITGSHLSRTHDFLEGTRETFRFEESPQAAGHPLTSDEAGTEWVQSIYGVTSPLFEQEIRDFLLGLFAERAIQASALAGRSSSEAQRELQGRLVEAASCSSRAQTQTRGLFEELARATPSPSPVAPGVERYRNMATLGASCLSAVKSRWAALQRELGVDVEIGRPLLSEEELAELPPGIRHLTRGLTGLPVLRHFLREMPTMSGFTDQQERPCSFLQDRFNPSITVERRDAATREVESWTMSRRAYCMNVYAEYTLLAQEAQQLANAFPTLMTPDASGAPTYQRIAAAAPRGSLPEIEAYDLDTNRRTSRETIDPATGGPAFCMTRLRGANGELREAPRPARVQFNRQEEQATNSMIESLLSSSRNLCDADKLHEAVTATLRSPELMQAYFDCNRRHFGSYLATLGVPSREWPGALGSEACRDRTNSAWIACRLYRDREAETIRSEIRAGILTSAMDALFFVAPGLGGVSSSAGRVAASMAFGGAMGGAIAGVLTPGGDAQAALPEFQAATFLSGYAPLSTYEAAIARLQRIRTRDPRVEAVLDGFFTGAAFGALGSGAGEGATAGLSGGRGTAPRLLAETALSDAQRAAHLEARLLQTYRSLRAEGALVGAEGAALSDDLLRVFDTTLRRRFPEVPESAWQGLSADAKMAILEGRFPPPGGGGGKIPAARRDAILASAETQRLIDRYADFRGITNRENAAYIALADGTNPLSSRVRLFFEVENSVLKNLNDVVFGSKDASNAAVNLFKSIFDRRLRNDPVLRRAIAGRYSDYKSMRLALLSDSPDVIQALQRAYSESADEFARALQDSPLSELIRGRSGTLGDPRSWNLAGVGRSADEASLAARTSRSFAAPGGTPLTEFPATQAFISDRLRTVEQLRSSLEREIPASTGILRESSRVPGRMILSEDAIDAVRKAKGATYDETIAALRSRLERRFGVTVTEAQTRQIYEYATFGDSLSPSVVQAERTVIDLGRARHGIVSVDIAGLGGRNLAETLDAATAAGTSSERAVTLARDSFRRVSSELDQLRGDFARALDRTLGAGTGRRTLFSGDDGILMPNRELTAAERARLVAELSTLPNPSRFRMTFVPQTFAEGGVIPAAQRSTRVVEAETFEKAIRESLEGRIPRADASRLLIAIESQPAAAGGGVFNLLIGNAGGPVSEATRRAVIDAYSASLPKGFTLGEIRWP
jgi:hypothetical protein